MASLTPVSTATAVTSPAANSATPTGAPSAATTVANTALSAYVKSLHFQGYTRGWETTHFNAFFIPSVKLTITSADPKEDSTIVNISRKNDLKGKDCKAVLLPADLVRQAQALADESDELQDKIDELRLKKANFAAALIASVKTDDSKSNSAEK